MRRVPQSRLVSWAQARINGDLGAGNGARLIAREKSRPALDLLGRDELGKSSFPRTALQAGPRHSP